METHAARGRRRRAVSRASSPPPPRVNGEAQRLDPGPCGPAQRKTAGDSEVPSSLQIDSKSWVPGKCRSLSCNRRAPRTRDKLPRALANEAWGTLNYNNVPQPLDPPAVNSTESLRQG